MCNLHYIFIAHTTDRTSITLSLCQIYQRHYSDVIMGAMASQITSLTIVCSTVYSGADQRKHQSSASLAFVRGIHRWPMNSPHKLPVTRKMFPFDDVIKCCVEYNPYTGYLELRLFRCYGIIIRCRQSVAIKRTMRQWSVYALYNVSMGILWSLCFGCHSRQSTMAFFLF